MKTAQYKYSKGDLVWRLKDRKIIQSTIRNVHITVDDSQRTVYFFENDNYLDSEWEGHLYETKEELIKSLTNES